MLNIVGNGQGGGSTEQDTGDMDAKATADMAKRYPGIVVGVKTAHYQGPEWTPVERAVEAGTLANIPVMVDFGTFRPERPFEELVLKKLRPGDISTHTFLGKVPMLDDKGRLRPFLAAAQKRGVIFDVGHGGGSFLFRQAVPAIAQGFLPDSISTDLHTESMNAGMKDMLNVMSKFLNIGMPLDDVIARSTWNPAREIKRTDLGNLAVGAPADIAVLRIEKGSFGFVDSYGGRMSGSQKLVCELTVRDGLVVWDLNGMTREDWKKLGNYEKLQDTRWDSTFGPLGPVPNDNWKYSMLVRQRKRIVWSVAILACCATIGAGQTARQAEAGQLVYAANCASCHLPDLGGRNEAPRLAGPNFMNAWGSRTTTDLLILIQSTMPPGNRGGLGAEAYVNLVAFLLAANGASPGQISR